MNGKIKTSPHENAGRIDGLASLAELTSMENSVAWLVQDLVPRRGLVLLYGPPGVGKSFVALDLALCVAVGRNWVDARQTQPHPVVYWAAEAGSTYATRARSWLEARQIPSRNVGDIQFHLLDKHGLDLSNPDDTKVELILTEILAQVGGDSPLLIIDTVAAAAPSLDENDPSRVGRLIARCRAITTATRATVLLVHHSGKTTGRGPRGHSRFIGDVDAVFRLAAHGRAGARPRGNTSSLLALVTEKQRFAAESPPILIRVDANPGMATPAARVDQGASARAARQSGRIAQSPIADAVANPLAGAELSAFRILVEMHRNEGASEISRKEMIDSLCGREGARYYPDGRSYGRSSAYDACERLVERGILKLRKNKRQAQLKISISTNELEAILEAAVANVSFTEIPVSFNMYADPTSTNVILGDIF